MTTPSVSAPNTSKTTQTTEVPKMKEGARKKSTWFIFSNAAIMQCRGHIINDYNIIVIPDNKEKDAQLRHLKDAQLRHLKHILDMY